MNDGSSIGSANEWLIALTSGSLAIALAVLAVAGIGFAMLTGRMDLRRAGRVMIGCFLIFGAGTLAAQLLSFTNTEQETPAAAGEIFKPEFPTPAKLPRASPAPNDDPYAGAALPEGR